MANAHDGKRTRADRGEEYPAIALHCSVVYPGDVVSIQLSEDVLLAEAVAREVELTVATLYPIEEGKEPHSVAVVCRVGPRRTAWASIGVSPSGFGAGRDQTKSASATYDHPSPRSGPE